MLEIDSLKGTARAKQEGKADILLSNSINAASIVHVGKVKHAELDNQAVSDLALNIDDRNDILRPRVKLYLQN